MSDSTPLEAMKEEASLSGKDSKTRKLLIGMIALWLFTLAVLLGIAWNAYFKQKAETQTLAQQIALACDSGHFGPNVSEETEKVLCDNASRVIENKNISPAIPGPQGNTGPQGPRGWPGSDGADGAVGPRGPPGADGTNGIGEKGLDGTNGADGADGKDGSQGPQGEPGPAGPPGADGAPGTSGVVSTQTVNCDGPLISNVSLSYDQATQTITLTCNN